MMDVELMDLEQQFFRSIYYILNNVVNLIKCGVFILLVVVSSFKNSGHYMLLWFETNLK
jgi:hypothetical protein